MIYKEANNTATILINRGEGYLNETYRKEKHFSGEYCAIDPSTGRALVTIRIYWTASRCYACAWFNGPDGVYLSGSGWAGGGGYCKESAAIGDAIGSANIILENAIDGRGVHAVEDAVICIGLALNHGEPVIFHKAHA